MREQEVVSLETELEVLKDYISLLQIRFGESLSINLKLEPDTGIAIPPLTLQMLISSFSAIREVVVFSGSRLKISLADAPDKEPILISRERVELFRKWLDQ